ncbi:antibiotic biosynthesis monooxygenase family protein [Chloroflexota bacterium]
MSERRAIQIVQIECQPEAEDKLNKWLDGVHIPLLLKFKGLRKVTRCKALKKEREYLVISEFDSPEAQEAYQTSPELAAAREEGKETWKVKGYEVKSRMQYEILNTRENP